MNISLKFLYEKLYMKIDGTLQLSNQAHRSFPAFDYQVSESKALIEFDTTTKSSLFKSLWTLSTICSLDPFSEYPFVHLSFWKPHHK